MSFKKTLSNAKKSAAKKGGKGGCKPSGGKKC